MNQDPWTCPVQRPYLHLSPKIICLIDLQAKCLHLSSKPISIPLTPQTYLILQSNNSLFCRGKSRKQELLIHPCWHAAPFYNLNQSSTYKRNRIQVNECQELRKLLKIRLKSIKDKCKEEKISSILMQKREYLVLNYKRKKINPEVCDSAQWVLSLACTCMHQNIYICLWFYVWRYIYVVKVTCLFSQG